MNFKEGQPGYTVTYIYHDCFVIETSDTIFIFDYWKDPLSKGKNKDFPPLTGELDSNKKIYVLVSHHHKDHFSKRIFLWSKLFPHITYIISRDVFKAVRYMLSDGGIFQGHKPPLNCVKVLDNYQSFSDSLVKITAFPSTDIGNSYVIECGGYRFFHAGDLNAWLWIDESTDEEIETSRNQFTEIIDKIQTQFPFFDVVMFPVDSRLGTEYWWGAHYFLSKVLTKVFIPMHFELVVEEETKEQRRIDAAAFRLFAGDNVCCCLQLASSRSQFLSNEMPYRPI